MADLNDDDKEIEALENLFPTLVEEAFNSARQRALDAGLSVYETIGDAIYEVFPDGTQRLVKRIEPWISIPLDTLSTLR